MSYFFKYKASKIFAFVIVIRSSKHEQSYQKILITIQKACCYDGLSSMRFVSHICLRCYTISQHIYWMINHPLNYNVIYLWSQCYHVWPNWMSGIFLLYCISVAFSHFYDLMWLVSLLSWCKDRTRKCNTHAINLYILLFEVKYNYCIFIRHFRK